MLLNVGGTRGVELHATTFGLRSTAELHLSDAVTPAAGVDWTYATGTFAAAVQAPGREGDPRYLGPTNPALFQNAPFWQSQLGLWTELRLRPVPDAADRPRGADGRGDPSPAADADRHRRPAAGGALDADSAR